MFTPKMRPLAMITCAALAVGVKPKLIEKLLRGEVTDLVEEVTDGQYYTTQPQEGHPTSKPREK